jgi:multisubunit Na+/H+ antiporter MnhB subunit
LEREQWFRTNPFEAVLFGIGAGAMAGVPLLLGFLAKEVFTRALFGDTFPALTPAIAVGIVASVLSVAYSLKLFVSTFWGPSAPDQARSASPGTISSWLLVVPACLLVPLLVGGFVPATVAGLLEPETPWEGGLAIWHQVDAKVAVSVGIFASGILLFWVWRRVERIPNAPLPLLLSEWAAERLLAVSGWLGHALQAGGHPRYLGIILIAAIVAMGGGGVLVGGSSAWQFGWGDELDDALVPTLAIIGGAILTVALRSRVAKLVMMAVTGYGLALIFALYRAPDLALTQILAETISLVFLLLIFRSLPTLARDSRPAGQKLAHGTIAMATGLAMAALAWGAGVCTPADRAGAGHLVQSLPAAKGRNVVNVILVDFRGADTLGEIVVLAIAAIGILALLRQLPPAKQTEEPACGR